MECMDTPRYFNEPSYETRAGTAAGGRESAAYNRGVRRGTVAHAVLAPLRAPPPFFAVVAASPGRVCH